jgi:hypothetical protein
MEERENLCKNLVGKPERKKRGAWNPNVDRRISIIWILKKLSVGVWAKLIWHRI